MKNTKHKQKKIQRTLRYDMRRETTQHVNCVTKSKNLDLLLRIYKQLKHRIRIKINIT